MLNVRRQSDVEVTNPQTSRFSTPLASSLACPGRRKSLKVSSLRTVLWPQRARVSTGDSRPQVMLGERRRRPLRLFSQQTFPSFIGMRAGKHLEIRIYTMVMVMVAGKASKDLLLLLPEECREGN